MNISTSKRLDKIEEIKHSIRTAIETKGIEVLSTDKFETYSDKILEISGGGSGYLDVDFENPDYEYLNEGWVAEESTKSCSPNIDMGTYLIVITWSYTTSSNPISTISSVKVNNKSIKYDYARTTSSSGSRYGEACSVIGQALLTGNSDTVSITATYLDNMYFRLYKINNYVQEAEEVSF